MLEDCLIWRTGIHVTTSKVVGMKFDDVDDEKNEYASRDNLRNLSSIYNIT